MQASVISEQGMRPEMEDAHVLDMDFGGRGWVFGGIYDGHGGRQAAEYASQRLHQLFLEKILSGIAPPAAFIESYETVSAELREQDSGTTAVTFLIRNGQICTANAGDARAIIVSNAGFQQLTTDHRLDNPAERQRIAQMGGAIHYPYVYRGYLGLMPTRTIGDEFFKPVGVIAIPSVSDYQITTEDIFLLAACDGLFDVMTNEEVAELARQHTQARPLVEALRQEVLVNRLGSDNLTIIAVLLR